MKNRSLPYGYEMQNGTVAENANESEIVRMLFSAYAGGASFKTLAEQLVYRGVPFHNGDVRWNKNKVARILNSELYCGNAGYPALIDRSLYEQAMARKPACGETSNDARRVKAIRALSRCAVCGGTIRMSAGRRGWTRWNCADCGALGTQAETERIMGNLTTLYRALLRGEYEICAPASDVQADEMLRQKESTFDNLLDDENFNETDAMAAAMELAAMRYSSIGTEDYETRRILYLIEQHTQEKAETDITEIKEIASAILIHPNGDVSIRLKNGQLIGGKA